MTQFRGDFLLIAGRGAAEVHHLRGEGGGHGDSEQQRGGDRHAERRVDRVEPTDHHTHSADHHKRHAGGRHGDVHLPAARRHDSRHCPLGGSALPCHRLAGSEGSCLDHARGAPAAHSRGPR